MKKNNVFELPSLSTALSLLSMASQVEQLKNENKKISEQAARIILKALDAKDSYTFGHSMRVAYFSLVTGTEAKLSTEEMYELELSAIFHGLFLLVAVLTIPSLLNKIPMASLAAILIMIGFKLASVKTFRHVWNAGKQQFIPFVVTVVAVVFTDLLKGVGIGLAFSIYFILRGNMKLAYFFNKEHHNDSETTQIDLAQEVSFLNKAMIKQSLSNLPNNSKLIINAAHTVYIDHDVLELIRNFVDFGSKDKNIKVKLINFRPAYKMENAEYDYSTMKQG